MDVSFISLVRGNRLTQYLGLAMLEGYEYKYGKDYTYIEVPVSKMLLKGEEVSEAKKLQRVQLVAACTVTPKGSGTHLLVEPNRELSELGIVQAPYYLHNGDATQVPSVYISLIKDIELSSIPFCVRIYLRN